MHLNKQLLRHHTRFVSWQSFNRQVALSAGRQNTSEHDSLMSIVNQYSKYRPYPFKLKDWLEFGQEPSESKALSFLRNETPIRISTILQEMNHLPKSLLEHKWVKRVKDCYLQSLSEIMTFQQSDVNDPSEHARFKLVLSIILERHTEDVQKIGKGVVEISDALSFRAQQHINYYLDRIYMTKISARMLQHQYSCIDPDCNITGALVDAYEDARVLCEIAYGSCPKLEVEIQKFGQKMENNLEPVTIVYVPSHIRRILIELLKNSMRAQMDLSTSIYASKTEDTIEPIRVVIYQGDDEVTIRISDRGGGIPRHYNNLVFDYAFTTAKHNENPGDDIQCTRLKSVALAGYGYGLPLARLYARYFGGEVALTSIDGLGTDAHVYLHSSPIKASERLSWYSPLKKIFTN